MRQLLAFCVLAACALPLSADVGESIKKLSSKDATERRAAARELADAGPDAAKAVSALTKALKDEDRFVRRFSAQALGSIGPAAKSAIPTLQTMLDDGTLAVRQAAINAIARMGPDGVPALGKSIGKDSALDVIEVAIEALSKAGPAGVTPLLGAVKDQGIEAAMRRRALVAVQMMGAPAATSAIPVFVEILKAPKGRGDVRLLRLDAITGLGALAKSTDSTAVAALNAIINDEKNKDMGLKNQCRNALKKIMARK